LKRSERLLAPEEEGAGLTYQFAGEEQRELRLYVWGNAEYGALGQPGFLMPRSVKRNILTQMHKPYRFDFFIIVIKLLFIN
jgi:hypothetical protein